MVSFVFVPFAQLLNTINGKHSFYIIFQTTLNKDIVSTMVKASGYNEKKTFA